MVCRSCVHPFSRSGRVGQTQESSRNRAKRSSVLAGIVQFQKISILSPQKGLEFPGGGGSVRPKNVKKCMKLHWNFQRGRWGGGGLEKIPSVGEVWIFSGITHFQLLSHCSFNILTYFASFCHLEQTIPAKTAIKATCGLYLS